MTFDGTIALGQVLQIVVFVVALTAAYFKLDKRLAVLETKINLLPCRKEVECKKGE